MPARESAADRGARLASRLRLILGEELRAARIAAGLSQRAVGRAVGVSYSQVGRIERGVLPSLRLDDLAALAAALGLELSARLYPVGSPLRDAGQSKVVSRLRGMLHPSLSLRTEVPMPMPGDLRAWDGVIRGAAEPIGVEVEMRVLDAQALERRIALKQRDSGIERVIVVVPDTRHNRHVLRASPELRAAFPVPARVILAALREGRDPGGSGIVIL